MSSSDESKFEINLKGLRLPGDVQKRLNSELQEVVLRELLS